MTLNGGHIGLGLLLVVLPPIATAGDTKEALAVDWYLEDIQEWPDDLRQEYDALDEIAKEYVELCMNPRDVQGVLDAGKIRRIDTIKSNLTGRSRERALVAQVVDANTMRIKVTKEPQVNAIPKPGGGFLKLHAETQYFYVEGIPTQTLTDGARIDGIGAWVFDATGTKTYETVAGGSNTIVLLKTIDHLTINKLVEKILSRGGFRF